MVLSLTAFIAACSTAHPNKPPDILLADCPHAVAPVDRTNAGLARYVQDERHALNACNTDKAALRAFYGE